MLRFHSISSFVTLSLSLLFCASTTYAQSTSIPLENGLSMEEVIKRWGPPTSKDEQEIKRINIWNYNNSKVVFREGKLTSWTSNGMESLVANPEEGTPQAAKPVEMDDILSEIIKEVPSDDSPVPGGANPMVPGEVKPLDLN